MRPYSFNSIQRSRSLLSMSIGCFWKCFLFCREWHVCVLCYVFHCPSVFPFETLPETSAERGSCACRKTWRCFNEDRTNPRSQSHYALFFSYCWRSNESFFLFHWCTRYVRIVVCLPLMTGTPNIWGSLFRNRVFSMKKVPTKSSWNYYSVPKRRINAKHHRLQQQSPGDDKSIENIETQNMN